MDRPSGDVSARHLRLITDTIAAVNSTLDLGEVFELVAAKVAEALEADACFVYLYDEAGDELVLRASCGTRVEDMTRVPKMRPGEGITGTAAAARAPIMIPRAAHLDPRFKSFPNLREEQYESILAVPILASRPWPAPAPAGRSPAPPPRDAVRTRAWMRSLRGSRLTRRGCAPSGPAPPAAEHEVPKERLEGALNVRTERAREFTEAEIELLMAIAGQVAQAIENAKLYDHAQRRVAELEALARISEAVSESLYLEESLEAIVETTMTAVNATGAALVLEGGTIAWPEGRAGAHAIRLPLRWKGREIGELVCDRDTAFSQDEERLLASIANQAAAALEHGRAVMRGVLAQEIHHRVKNNLQTVASLLRLQARTGVDAPKALDDSVNRILAIAAVHEVLTERRDEDVDLAELVERLRATLLQGVGAGKHVESSVEPVSLHGDRATAVALVFSELFQNALEHGGNEVRVELARRDGAACLTVSDDGDWSASAEDGTGLSIVRALVRDELKGSLSLSADGGLRAEVAFPA
jgi:two-component system, sensor histidine kinase PdtaS